MAAFDPPWRLDPLKRIVGVGWGGGALAVLHFKFTAATSGTSSTWKAFFTGDTDDATLSGQLITGQVGPLVTPPGPPKSSPPPDSIPGNNSAWSYPPVTNANTETTTQTVTVIDLGHYVGYIGGGHPFFGGDFATADEAYDSFAESFEQLTGRPPDPNDPNDLFVQLTAIKESHEETVTVATTTKTGDTITFINLTRITNQNPLVKLNKLLKVVIRMDGGDSNQFVDWTATLTVFIGGVARKFIVDRTLAQGVKTDPDKPFISSKQEKAAYPPETAKPVVQVSFVINMTDYGITSSKQNV